MFSIGFDPGSLEKLAELAGTAALLDREVIEALVWIGELVTTTAQTNTWTAFQNPTGETADSIGFQVVSTTEVDITADTPQARRLEYGFSGMTDSLGRYYPYWPAEPYMGPALETDTPLIEEKMIATIESVLARLEE